MSASSYKHTSGFTLVNVLLFLAISSILFAIAIPVITSLNKKLHIQQLDASARHIFLSSQNQLTALRSNGNLTMLSDALPLSEEPSDYSGRNWQSLSYLDSSNPAHSAALEILLPQGSIDPNLYSGNYVVEVDLNTGCIYAVFYSENSFSYEADLPREREERFAYDIPLGYYGGNLLEGSSSAVVLPDPNVTITNQETLSITFETENPFLTISDGEFFKGLTYTVTVRSQADPSRFNTFSSDLLPSPFTKDIYTYTLLLDSLVAGEQFKDICPDVPPGDTLSITVSVSYSGSAGIALPASTTQSVNSLFAARSDQAVTLAYARHLQNLEPSVSGVSTVTSAVQIDTIDWSDYEMDFTPVSNSQLTAFDGSGLAIQNLTVGSANAPSKAGLFGEFAGGTLSNIRLVNATITGGTYAGGLVGYCNQDLTINNAAIYVEDVADASTYQVTGTQYVGGLIAYCGNLTISNSFAAPGRIHGGDSNQAMGGLIAFCCGTNSKISKCYANTNSSSDASPDIGGLVGHFCGTRIQNSYALGNLSAASSNYYGGFVGNSSNATYTNCYAAVSFEGAGSGATPYGFSGSDLHHLTNCVSLQQNTYGNTTPHSDVPIASYSELISWDGGTAWTSAAWSNTHPYSAQLLAEENPYPFPRLKALEHYNDWPEEPTFDYTTMFAYYEIYQDETYGYHALDADGNVILDTLFDTKGALVSDGYVFLTTTPLENLYFHYYATSFWSAYLGRTTITVNGTSIQYYQYAIPDYVLSWNDFLNPSSFYIPIMIDHVVYWFCPNFAKTAINGATTHPSFNGTAYIRSTRHLSALGSWNNFYYNSSRTYVQELNLDFNLKRYHLIDEGNNHKRYIFLDAILYNSNFVFEGLYEGNNHTITLSNYSNGWDVGLFGHNSGTIQNVKVRTTRFLAMGFNNMFSGVLSAVNAGTIQNCSVTFGADFKGRGTPFGTIAGKNTGIIKNCLVTSDGAVTVTGDQNFLAGFVGQNNGTITDCYVRPGVSSYSGLTLSGSYQTAGFVYHNTDTIQRCSAVGTVNDASCWGCVAAGFVYHNSGTITNSYANCLVSGMDAAGFAYLSNDSNSVIENCYAMVKVSANQDYGDAAGFTTYLGNSRMQNCYVAAKVTGLTSYSFSLQTPQSTCYYLDWDDCGFYKTGTGLSHSELTQLFAGDSINWGGANTYVYRDQYADLPDACPFPLITGMDHYGDWPFPPTNPPITELENVLGIFYYEKRADHTYYISAAALQYEVQHNDAVLNLTMIDFIKADFDLSPYLSTHTLSDSGYGVFWAKDNAFWHEKFFYDFAVFDGAFNNGRFINSLNTTKNLAISDSYYFIPFNNASIIRYYHDNGKSPWNWWVTFSYNPATDTYTATKGQFK